MPGVSTERGFKTKAGWGVRTLLSMPGVQARFRSILLPQPPHMSACRKGTRFANRQVPTARLRNPQPAYPQNSNPQQAQERCESSGSDPTHSGREKAGTLDLGVGCSSRRHR